MKIGLGTRLWVPYQERDEAQALGAKWSPGPRRYVVSASMPLEPFARWIRPDLTDFPGEDRDAGGRELYVDLIPASCWFSNVRSCVDAVDWLRIRTFVGNRCGWACEVCGTEDERLDVHERWSYDDDQRVQKLVRLIGLCEWCHRVTHYAKATLDGYSREAFAHLQRVNQWDERTTAAHIVEASDIFEQRSEHEWALDLSIIEAAGLQIIQPRTCA